MRKSTTKFGRIVVALCVLAWAGIAGAESMVPSTRPAGLAVRPWMPKGFHVVRDVAYVPHGRRSQMLDVYVPDVLTAPRPVMVWIHGGGWYSGDKSAPPGMGLLLRGYVVASINYRLSSEALFPAQIFDCKAAIRFLRAHSREYGIDSTRIGVWGDSAGGQLAALLGTTNGRAGIRRFGRNPGGLQRGAGGLRLVRAFRFSSDIRCEGGESGSDQNVIGRSGIGTCRFGNVCQSGRTGRALPWFHFL